MPNLKNIRKWIDALESGEYPQGNMKLARKNSLGKEEYCCLGVVCELAIADGVEISKKYIDGIDYAYYESAYCYLPFKASKWLGLEDGNPTIYSRDRDISAAAANDTLCWSFKRIAQSLRHKFFNEPLPEVFSHPY